MLLWKAEVQYVCRNAARQLYGQQIRGPRRYFGAFSPVWNVTTGGTV
jgi:hypothetical protein